MRSIEVVCLGRPRLSCGFCCGSKQTRMQSPRTGAGPSPRHRTVVTMGLQSAYSDKALTATQKAKVRQHAWTRRGGGHVEGKAEQQHAKATQE